MNFKSRIHGFAVAAVNAFFFFKRGEWGLDKGYRVPSRRTSRNKSGRTAMLWFILGVGLTIAGYFGYEYITREEGPNTAWSEPNFGQWERPVIVQGEVVGGEAMGSEESLSLPLELLQTYVDPTLVYDKASDSVIVTTSNQVIQMKTDQLTALVNDEPKPLRFAVQRVEDQIYVPMQPLVELLQIHVQETESGAVLLYHSGEVIQWLEVVEPDDELKAQLEKEGLPYRVPVRENDSQQAPIIAELSAGEKVKFIEESQSGWYKVILESGFQGFVSKAGMRMSELEKMPEVKQITPHVPWSPLGGKINLTWEAVYSRNPDTSQIPDMPGLNVVSPTWFALKEDAEGGFYVHNMADAAYVSWAHQRGYQVWGLFSNDFDPDLTSKMLANYETRKQIIFELLRLAELYNLQGINIDFENVYVEDKDLLSQFVREMTPYMHEQDLVVSIDVTIRGGSPMWSLFADRAALGKVVDYMMVMTYDQHWRTSPVAGSVAELPWVEKGIRDIIEIDGVPSQKILVGVPFYTYQWFEELDPDGNVENVSSKTLFMSTVEDIIEEKQLTPIYQPETGQHYVEYEEDGQRVKIWLEDATSMKARAELVQKLDLAGIASWRRGFETPDIWQVIQDTLKQQP